MVAGQHCTPGAWDVVAASDIKFEVEELERRLCAQDDRGVHRLGHVVKVRHLPANVVVMSNDFGPTQVFADDGRVAALSAYTDHLDELMAVFTDANAGDGDGLDRRPAEGAWSVGEVLHHLADAELNQSVRLRELLVTDNPVWLPWDEAGYAGALGYDVRPAADALTLLLAIRQINSRLLASLSPDAWLRTAQHSQRGAVDLADWVQGAADHLGLHVLQARRALIGMI